MERSLRSLGVGGSGRAIPDGSPLGAIGGGPAGLSTAWRIAPGGILIEADPST